MTIVGDATTWSIILTTRVIVYDRNMFIIQATGFIEVYFAESFWFKIWAAFSTNEVH